MFDDATIHNSKTIFIHLIKLQYVRVKAGSLRPARSRGPAKILRFDITNKLDYTCGVPDDVLSMKFAKAVENDIEYKKKNGLPIAMYDRDERKAYLLYPDGSREYVY